MIRGNEMKIENEELTMKEKNDPVENNAIADAIIEEFSIEGLPQHNRSLTWLFEQGSRMGARFYPSSFFETKYRDGFRLEFNSPVTGISYAIEVGLNREIASILSSRISDVDFHSPGASKAIHPLITSLVVFDVFWCDVEHRNWKSMCIENYGIPDPFNFFGEYDFTNNQIFWPTDQILSLIAILRDDFRSSLDNSQYSFQQELVRALPMYWFAGKTPANMGFEQLVMMMSTFSALTLCSTSSRLMHSEVEQMVIEKLSADDQNYREITEELEKMMQSGKISED